MKQKTIEEYEAARLVAAEKLAAAKAELNEIDDVLLALRGPFFQERGIVKSGILKALRENGPMRSKDIVCAVSGKWNGHGRSLVSYVAASLARLVRSGHVRKLDRGHWELAR